jgi:hypothetical protein
VAHAPTLTFAPSDPDGDVVYPAFYVYEGDTMIANTRLAGGVGSGRDRSVHDSMAKQDREGYVRYLCLMTEGRSRVVANHGDYPVLARIADNLVQSSIVKRWPGGHVVDRDHRRFVYTFEPSVVDAVGQFPELFTNEAAAGVFDPHLLHNDGSLWLGSVSGDRAYWLELGQEGRRQVSDAGGLLASILSPTGNTEYLAPMSLEAGANWLDPEVVQEP